MFQKCLKYSCSLNKLSTLKSIHPTSLNYAYLLQKASFCDKSDNDKSDVKSLVEKLDKMMMKAEEKIKLESLVHEEEIEEKDLKRMDVAFSSSKKSSRKQQNDPDYKPMQAFLTDWTMPNLLEPLDLNSLPSRRRQHAVVGEGEYEAEEEKYCNNSVRFATLLRQSGFIAAGNFHEIRLTGVVFDIFGHDLYVDFGGKFHCVHRITDDQVDRYRRGSLVRLVLYDPEMVSTFMLDEIGTTLLEADGVVVGPVSHCSQRDLLECWTP